MARSVLPLTREWIEISYVNTNSNVKKVLPLTREWIEIIMIISLISRAYCSPSYEGVD